ncbi:MAG TPA: hypothetical protein ENI79_00385 [Rhodospirillales bacterium]|mgnify:CR=1 FL=1|nr:hypothetical protein [Rhodospirillales bacterium]
MKRLVAALALSFFLILLNIPEPAAAGYKPLPQGTVVKYDTWNYKVLSSSDDGEEIETNLKKTINPGEGIDSSLLKGLKFKQHSGLLLEGYNGFFVNFILKIDAQNKKKLRSLFPLAVGKTVEVNYQFDFVMTTATFAVTGAQTVNTPMGAVKTFVITEESLQDLGEENGFVKQNKTLWFAPSLGVVVMGVLSEELIGIDSEIAFIKMPEIFLPTSYKLQKITLP